MTVAVRLLVVGTALILALPASAQDEDPCSKVACSGHGNCLVVNGVPRCACSAGYTADASQLNCVPIREVMPPKPAAATSSGDVSAWEHRERRKMELMDQGYISKRRYAGAGFLGTFIGLGLGHVAVHEWLNFGWVYTVGEIVLGGGALLILAAEYNNDLPGKDMHWFQASVWMAILAGVVKVVEMFDIWIRPHRKIITTEMLLADDWPDP